MDLTKLGRSPAVVLLCLLILLNGCVSRMPTGLGSRVSDRQQSSGSKTAYTVFGKTYQILPDSKDYLDIGIASWYGKKFHGRTTSNGEIYNMYALTAAHRSLPLPTYVKVTNLDNRRSIIVKVNDRGPFHDDRLIDLSFRAAQELGFSDEGTAPVVVEAVDSLNYPKGSPNGLPNGSPSGSPNGSLNGSTSSVEASGATYYLQLGAFVVREGAEALMQDVKLLIADRASKVDIRILESARETSVLHKVWLGPLSSLQEREALVVLVENAQLGKPIRIEVN
jgi:rare lipoprotein A|tara:strand:+ start:9944 stop:10783 length:840 start_codon:yes stop_codon:yes gene_type:complete